MKKIKLTPREQTFFMKGWTLEEEFARKVLQSFKNAPFEGVVNCS